MALPWWGTACRRRAALARGAGLALALASLMALQPSAARADQNSDIPEPITITLPAIEASGGGGLRNGQVDHVDLLPDGRIAAIGGTSPAKDGLLRIIDPKTGAEKDYDIPGWPGIGTVKRAGSEAMVAGGSIFIYAEGKVLLRASEQDAMMSEVVFDHERDGQEASGAIVGDGDSILVSWWDAYEEGRCGAGPGVTRFSAEGKVIWRWRDRTGGYNFPNDMVVLSDGTILVLVEGDANEYMGTMWNPCVHGWEYLVALSADGREIARRELPHGLWLGPLSLGWSGKEVVAPAGFDVSYGTGLGAILRIRIEGSRIAWNRVDVSDEVSNAPYAHSVVTSLEAGGYLVMPAFGASVMRLNEKGDLLRKYRVPLNTERRWRCGAHSNQGLVCWDDSEIIGWPLR